MGGTAQREAQVDPVVASNIRTVTIVETGWWLISCKFAPATTRYLRVEREGKRPLVVPFNAGAPVLNLAMEGAAYTPTAIFVNAAGTIQDSGTILNIGISIWLERGDRFLLVNSTGATVATDVWTYGMINTKFLPVVSYFGDNVSLPA